MFSFSSRHHQRAAIEYLVVLLLVPFLALGAGHHGDTEFVKGKICIGTNGRMSVPSNREHHYRNLRDRYTNCTYVDGNLELTWLQDENLDLSFLHNIREVTGYVLISHVDVRRIVLPRLQIIRGRTLFKINVRDEEFALMVTLSKMYSLEMPALRDTLLGSIGLFNNYNLCHVKTINWKEIITDPKGKYVYVYNFTSPERECPSCHNSCEAGCWGDGSENCQKFSKENCSPQCYQGRCFGPNPRECCHLFCAGGCTGPKQSDCLACRNFYDDGVCTQECPPMQRYNPSSYSWEPNPNGKYAYGATCVKNCPEHLLKDSGACVRSCPQTKKAVGGECVPCDGPCPKTCPGVPSVHSGNIDNFKDCTIIEGSLSILDQSFKGFQQVYANFSFGQRYTKMDPERLRIFSTLREVTGYINIQAVHENFTDLSYFENLESIGGRVLTEYFSSLYIVKTSLVSLGLKSLKKINSGAVAILENKNLCFAQDINWKKIKKSADHVSYLQMNRNKTSCALEGLKCDAQCSSDGCWGPGPDQCLSCANFKSMNNTCLQNCSTQSGLYRDGPNICKPCDFQCGSTCHGPGPGNCDSCRYVKDGPFCVSACPTTKYEENGECRPCHDNCVGGCLGPENNIGPKGCNSCEKAIINGNINIEGCLQKNESCPDGYYYEWVGPQEQGPLRALAGKGICRKCHPRCKKCTGYGFHEQVCKECTKFKRGEQCEDECPQDHYPDDLTQNCVECDVECRGCTGPGVENCHSCVNYRIYISDNTTQFKCTSTCPTDMPHKIFSDNNEPYCSDQLGITYPLGSNQKTSLIFFAVLAFFCILVIFLAIIVFQYCRKVKVKESAVKMTMALTGLEDNEPLRPTNVKPNLAKLRIIKEGEMRRGGILGYGAFGTVYKGVWVPEGEHTKIPVAIKVLRDGTGANSSKEFLEEAYIMATVEHPNLLQLLAVCMTSQMMLITQLMPLGCLLDFVRNNREKIGSKALLNWCTQIARGMSYLEEKRLVHRDLAARNVLVQTPGCIKITDFGLAKLLDINEDEYKAAGGKMPIKWLALECIQHRIFTHKSDVWAFGVTVWELLTYGGRPYESVPARDVPELLEKGERLNQPNICTIEVYMIMIKCWMLDAESRPGFKELADEFAKMARDPGRYLVIQGDKFMRLPTYPVQVSKDEKELMASLATTMDSSEGQLEGDDYLQPKSRLAIAGGHTTVSTVSGSTPPTPIKFWPPGSSLSSDGSCAPQNQHNWNQEMLRLRAAAAGLQDNGCTSDGSSSRYCSDPLKMIGNKDEGEDCYDSCSKSQAQVGTIKLELPLDEDDYLMPSPQQNQPATAYVDLIGDSKHSDNPSSSGYRQYPDFLPHAGQTDIDNPEYIMSQESVPSQTIGIPTICGMVSATTPSPEGTANGKVPGYHPQRSSEEESDHEYYNDFDRLQRELQPLRKSETTV